MSAGPDPLARILKHLDEGAPPADQAAACATIAILCSQPTPPENLDGVCEKLLKLAGGSEEGVKPNAIAAMSATMEVSEQFCKDAVTHGAAATLVPLLTAAAPAGATDASQPARQIALNAASALGALGEASEAGLQAVLDAGGVPAIIAAAAPAADPMLQEAAVDALCKLMASGGAAKDAAIAADAVPALAALLSTDGKNAEVTVRALLGLGMAVGGSEVAQVQLAAAPGAVGALLALMRQGDDGDCQHIAAGLFQGLAAAPAAKAALAEGMRAAQAAAQQAETARYTF